MTVTTRPVFVRSTKPALTRTSMCLSTVGKAIERGADSSLTDCAGLCGRADEASPVAMGRRGLGMSCRGRLVASLHYMAN